MCVLSNNEDANNTRPSSPDSYNGFFYHASWSQPWYTPGCPPERNVVGFFHPYMCQPWWDKGMAGWFLGKNWGNWPWGYFIYRAVYGSNEDWNRALNKLNQYIQCMLQYHDDDPEAAQIVWEGYRSVIVEDKEQLEGASPAKIRMPRSTFCLMIDNHALQSILASPEPSLETKNWLTEKAGYVILIDRSFPDEGLEYDPYYGGWVRLKLEGVWLFTRFWNPTDLLLEEEHPPINNPRLIPYTDGFEKWVESVSGEVVLDTKSSGGEGEANTIAWRDPYEYLREGGYV
ncbi:hypothetical protein BDV26DRAFT_281431 [Aspergillus bertholletiae]|uniref:Uncharacterized protein n=1 Tax=Aspergillus bertholletiae TaxID=1226010 RepID=A0A5N7B859_9EURO|nr:hypothetical protein BDV26DRAFT_281431 [Aspergillus bertholletiae]